MNLVPKALIKNNITWKTELLSEYLMDSKKVLDFGCGDLSLAESLRKKNKHLQITGIDIVEFSRKVPGISFVSYDGSRMPFKDNFFDTVFSFYVFHHCEDAKKSFQECLRVAKKQVIFVEPVKRYPQEKYLMGAIDYLYNVWKEKSIPYTDQFFSLSDWEKEIIKTRKVTTIPVRSFFPIPIGKAYIFKVLK